MAGKSNIALIGSRGIGKSKLSRRLKKLFQRPVMSTDALISYENEGLSITELVDKVGWAIFRQLEYEILKKISKMEHIIMDCGGGILFEMEDKGTKVDPKSMVEIYSETKAQLIKKKSHIIWLHNNGNGPPHKELINFERPAFFEDHQKLLRQRLVHYKKTADYSIDMSKHSIESASTILYDQYSCYVVRP